MDWLHLICWLDVIDIQQVMCGHCPLYHVGGYLWDAADLPPDQKHQDVNDVELKMGASAEHQLNTHQMLIIKRIEPNF